MNPLDRNKYLWGSSNASKEFLFMARVKYIFSLAFYKIRQVSGQRMYWVLAVEIERWLRSISQIRSISIQSFRVICLVIQ